VEQLLEHLAAGRYEEVAFSLCRDYYDRLYDDSRPEKNPFTAVMENLSAAETAQQLAAMLTPEKALSRS